MLNFVRVFSAPAISGAIRSGSNRRLLQKFLNDLVTLTTPHYLSSVP